MREDKLSIQSMDFAVDIINLVKELKSKKESIISNQIGRSGTSIGANCLTHSFNAMPPLHHRNPGLLGAGMETGIYAQIICDGLHIHKAVILAMYKIFGTDRLVLISDSMRATGMSDGEYEFGGQPIEVKNGVARTMEGAIAGSTTNLWACVNKAVEFGIPFEDAVKMATETPATMIGVNKGRLKEGFDADFVVLNDDLTINGTYIAGNLYQ